jgi:hypothetical protein
MTDDCRIRVEGSDVRPFQFSTTFVVNGLAASANPLEAHYLYGDGDLAVFLEDLGITVPVILRTLNQLTEQGSAETPVNIPGEVLEVLSRQARDAR